MPNGPGKQSFQQTHFKPIAVSILKSSKRSPGLESALAETSGTAGQSWLCRLLQALKGSPVVHPERRLNFPKLTLLFFRLASTRHCQSGLRMFAQSTFAMGWGYLRGKLPGFNWLTQEAERPHEEGCPSPCWPDLLQQIPPPPKRLGQPPPFQSDLEKLGPPQSINILQGD